MSLPPLAGIDPWTTNWVDYGYAVIEGDEGDAIDAGAGEDTAYGGLGEDAILGGTEADHLVGGSEGDYVDGGEGDDTILGDGLEGDMSQEPGMLWFYPDPEVHGRDVLRGGAGDDYLRGDGGADLLFGDEGDDVLAGDADHGELDARHHGDDDLDGGAGNDSLYGQGGNDALAGGEGNDTLMGDDHSLPAANHGADMLDGGAGEDTLVGAGGADHLFGGEGNDRLAGDGDDVAAEHHGADLLDGEGGNDYLRGYGGADLLYGGAGSDELHGEAGDDWLEGEDGNDRLYGEAGADRMLGGAGNDGLGGGEGDDWLDGGAGADTLEGGAGADTYAVDLDDAVTDAGAGDRIAFAAGIAAEDLQATLSSVGGQTWTTLGGEGQGGGLRIQGDLAGLDLSYAFAGGGALTRQQFLNTAYRSAVWARGGEAAEALAGYGGEDALEGGGGADSLHGGAGNDALAGGAGNDLYTYERGDGHDVIAVGGDGTDTLRFEGGISRAEVLLERRQGDLVARLADGTGSVTMTGWYAGPGGRIERIEFADGEAGLEELVALASPPLEGGEGADMLAGTPYADTLLGHGGEDTLDGGAGDDELQGGAGRDSYRLGLGRGRERIVDAGENAILLDGGLSFDDVDALREGDDLLLNVRGDDGQARLVGYFASATPWRVLDGAGGESDTEVLLEATRVRREDWLTEQRESYLARLRSDFLAPLLAQGGYQAQADGSYRRVEFTAANASFREGTQIGTTTSEWWSTGAVTTSTSNYSMNYWHDVRSAGIAENSFVFQVHDIDSDDYVIDARTAYLSTSLRQDSRYVELAWTTRWSGPRIQSSSTTSGPIYGGAYSSEVVGWSTTVSEQSYVEGRAEGRIVDAEPDGYHGIPHYSTLNPQWGYANAAYLTMTQNLYVVRGGDGDNRIGGGDMVDAGGGDDLVESEGFLFGGAGNDTLRNGVVMAGGAGSDYLEGGDAATRYLVSATEGGVDLVWDRGTDWLALMRGFYEALGIEDWWARYEFGGQWVLGLNGEGAIGFDTREEALEYAAQDEGGYWDQEPIYVEPLTVLPPVANDYAALEPLYTSGAIVRDTVEFAPDIAPQDLALSWGTWRGAGADEPPLRWTLDIRKNGAGILRVVVPNADDAVGTGVEAFCFADGTLLSIGQMIALAPPMPDLPIIMGTEEEEELSGSDGDEAILGLGGDDDIRAGAGDDELDGGAGDDRLDGEAGADAYFISTGDGLDFISDSGEDSGSFRDWYYRSQGVEDVELSEEYGGRWVLQQETEGEVYYEAFDTREEGIEFAVSEGLDPDDLAYVPRLPALPAIAGNDYAALEAYFGTGAIRMDRVVFGPGVDAGNLQISGNHEYLVVQRPDGTGAVLRLAQSDDPVGVGIERIEFADGTGIGVGEALRHVDEDHSLVGTTGEDRFILGAGNDLVQAREGDDRIDGGAGNDALDGGPGSDWFYGGEGRDTLDGGAGSDTYSVSPGWGRDVIVEGSDAVDDEDWIEFDYGMAPADLRVRRATDDANDLVIERAGSGDTLRFRGWFGPDVPARVEYFYFSQSRTVLDAAELEARIVPGGGRLEGGEGDDVLEGSAEDELLSGGAGSDTYRIDAGGGVDRIVESPSEAGIDAVEFGAGITPDMLSLGLGSLLIRIGGNGDELHLESFDPEQADAGAGIERFRFAGGGELGWAELIARGLDIAGSGADDALAGTSVQDRLYGYEGNDALRAGAGNDALTGGAGADVLEGGAGRDLYAFNRGDGADLIVEAGAADEGGILAFGEGIGAADLAWRREGEDLLVEYGAGDAVRIQDWPRQQAALWQVRFADGTSISAAQLLNAAPQAVQPLEAQAAAEDAAFAYAVPADAFVDPEGEALEYGATLADGRALPAWLGFDPLARTFSGTPENLDVGVYRVRVSATDVFGASAAQQFELTVANTNDAPVLAEPLADQAATQGQAFSYAVPGEAFADVDAGDVLSYAATLSDGGALPAWLTFEAATQSFAGTPGNGDVGAIDVRVGATDLAGASASAGFTLAVANVNDVPVLVQPLADQAATQGQAFSYSVPGGTFADIDAGDVLSYAATLSDGSALPAWLTFEAATQSFAGTPDAAAGLEIRLTATDAGGLAADDLFRLTVAPVAEGRSITGSGADEVLTGGAGNDTLDGGGGRDLLEGAGGDDTLRFAADGRWRHGNRVVHSGSPGIAGTRERHSIDGLKRSLAVFDGGEGLDTLAATEGPDAIILDDDLCGAAREGARIAGIELIEAGGGADVVDLTSRRYALGDVAIRGGAGHDVLWSSAGNDLIDGGRGNDRIDGGAGAEFIVGGAGHDVIDTGAGAAVVAFNRGDGHDSVRLGAGPATLSLGGGIGYEDLRLRRSGADLVLETGEGEHLALEGWYRRGASRPTGLTLQVIAEAMADFAPGGADPLRDNRVETFDLAGLAQACDEARAAHPGLTRWALADALAQFHLAGSDAAALGGELAWRYGREGALSGMSLAGAREVLGDAQFGVQAQSLASAAGLQETGPRL